MVLRKIQPLTETMANIEMLDTLRTVSSAEMFVLLPKKSCSGKNTSGLTQEATRSSRFSVWFRFESSSRSAIASLLTRSYHMKQVSMQN